MAVYRLCNYCSLLITICHLSSWYDLFCPCFISLRIRRSLFHQLEYLPKLQVYPADLDHFLILWVLVLPIFLICVNWYWYFRPYICLAPFLSLFVLAVSIRFSSACPLWYSSEIFTNFAFFRSSYCFPQSNHYSFWFSIFQIRVSSHNVLLCFTWNPRRSIIILQLSIKCKSCRFVSLRGQTWFS